MRDYCPECEKNGAKTRIKCFQINWQEAVFMCSSVQCPWPVEQEDLRIIQRPVGVFKTLEIMEEEANRYFKKEEDSSHGFLSTYTPPQTPEVIIKDNSSGVQGTGNVPVPVSTLTSLGVNDNIVIEFSIPCDTAVPPDSSSKSNMQTIKMAGFNKPISYKIENLPLPIDSSALQSTSDKSRVKTNVPLDNKKQDVCTSLASKPIIIKDEICDNLLPNISRSKLVKRMQESYRKKKEKFSKKINKFTFEGCKKEKQSTKPEEVKKVEEYVVEEPAIVLPNTTTTIEPNISNIKLPSVVGDIDISEFFSENYSQNQNINSQEELTNTYQSDADQYLLSFDSSFIDDNEVGDFSSFYT